MIVRAGLTELLEGKMLASTTYRLSRKCALQFGSSTLLAGSVPKRQVPRALSPQYVTPIGWWLLVLGRYVGVDDFDPHGCVGVALDR
jgi:hypothetical protein